MSEPKHRRIFQELLAEIAGGDYAPSGKLPSETQLVERFQASRPTVARALGDLQQRGLVERRVGSGTFVVDSSASGVAARQLGLLVPDLRATEVFETIGGELAAMARVHGYGLLTGDRAHLRAVESVEDQAQALCERFVRDQVAGVFFAPIERATGGDDTNRRLAERLRQAGIAVVLLDRDLTPYPSRSDFDLVGIDNFAAGYELASHLARLGCRELGFLSLPDPPPTVKARIAGAREALRDRGVEPASDFVRWGEPNDLANFVGTGANGRLDGALCANDVLAAACMQALEREGIRVPTEFRVAGFDDNRHASSISVRLTTMRQPCREIAAAALRTMLDRIAEPTLPARSVAISATLRVRESCGAYLSDRKK